MTKSSKPAFVKVNSSVNSSVSSENGFCGLVGYCYVNNLHQNFLKSEHLLLPMERLHLTLMCFGPVPKCK